MSLRYLLLIILTLTASNGYTMEETSTDLLTTSKDLSIVGARYLCLQKTAEISKRLNDNVLYLDNLAQESNRARDHLIDVQKEEKEFEEKSSLFNSKLRDCLHFLLIEFKESNEKFSNELVVSMFAKILTNADQLTKQGYISFYHARNTGQAFLSDLVKVLEEKKQQRSLSSITNFFMPNNIEKSKLYESIDAIYQKIKNSSGGDFNDQHPDWRETGLSVNIFLTGYWGHSRKDENTLRYFFETPSPAFNWNEGYPYAFLNKILKIYDLSLERTQKLIQIHDRYFVEKTGMSSRLSQIAIRKDNIDRLIKLTSDYGDEIPVFVKNNKKPSDIFCEIDSSGYDVVNAKIGKYEFKTTANLNTLQARMLVDAETFMNPEIVQVFDYQLGFSDEDKQKYFKELQEAIKD